MRVQYRPQHLTWVLNIGHSTWHERSYQPHHLTWEVDISSEYLRPCLWSSASCEFYPAPVISYHFYNLFYWIGNLFPLHSTLLSRKYGLPRERPAAVFKLLNVKLLLILKITPPPPVHSNSFSSVGAKIGLKSDLENGIRIMYLRNSRKVIKKSLLCVVFKLYFSLR